jgi:hypothetical protein
MKKFLRSIATVALATAATGALAMGWAGSASAAGAPPWEPDPTSVGALTFFNASGQVITGGSITDSPLAAYVEGTNTIRAGDTKATLFGYLPVNGQTPGQWSGEALGASTTFPNAAAPSPLGTSTLPVVTGASGDETIAQLEADFPNNDTSSDGYAGIYVLRLKTSATGAGLTTGYDSVDIQITGSTWSVIYPAATLVTTTTSLAAVPASPQVAGTSIQLSATVSPAAAPGTIQFEVGTTDIGTPVTVSSGTASISTSSLPVGTDTLNAVFTPASGSAYAGSTGSTSFTITAPAAAGTTTALAVDPSTAPADTAVSITATVSQTSNSSALASGAGQVKFYDDGTDSTGDITSSSVLLGTVTLGTGGVSSLSFDSFAVGAHNLVGEFIPTNAAVYNTSTSPAVLFTATTPAIAPDQQTVDVSIPGGGLTITTPYDPTNPFELGTAVLDPTDSRFTASAAFGSTTNPNQGVTITDTRAGDQSWTASATVTDFTDGSGDIINGQNLTFTGVTPSYITGNALQSGDVVTTDVTNSAIYAPAAPGSDGLKGGPHEFATAAAGAGSVYIDGVLTLTAPSSTPAGSYTATLTFTIV